MRITSLEALQERLDDTSASALADMSLVHLDELIRKAEYLRTALQLALGVSFTLDMNEQDRSYYAGLGLPASMLKNPAERWIDIRLSNQSPLASIYGEEKVLDAPLSAIKDALEQAGLIVVNQDIFVQRAHGKESSNGDAVTLHELWYSLFDYD